MNRLFAIILALTFGAWNSESKADSKDMGCVEMSNLFTKTLPEIGGKEWLGFQLKKNGEVWYLIFTQKISSPSSVAKWAVFSRLSEERPDTYCLLDKGISVNPLLSLHQTRFDERYGLPGSGNPRCGNTQDTFEGVKVRGWASQELGNSLILALSGQETTGASWVMLLSKKDGYWILLDKKQGEGTCYFDRGELSDIRPLSLK